MSKQQSELNPQKKKKNFFWTFLKFFKALKYDMLIILQVCHSLFLLGCCWGLQHSPSCLCSLRPHSWCLAAGPFYHSLALWGQI